MLIFSDKKRRLGFHSGELFLDDVFGFFQFHRGFALFINLVLKHLLAMDTWTRLHCFVILSFKGWFSDNTLCLFMIFLQEDKYL